ncbi:DUF4365 domain-containing protein [Myroides odoratimimus]|uniref:DUF4365 domain-containing protein n=1 Tax=Myroides odoratimimus TaxID=76832 RepID=UPI0025767CBE|nr:DUF4365 domain-containing protein [Myroides odoratimimus]MDM1415780.1 DUF4365 domain-containing protein [Myroides odoratimimus]MDM1445085.1 DUF4365 domain-containing protein [Myroides odoratimimus]MDM1448397.1 DUF4365 domain-containing protein [Myroides odoratimimus]MDM1511082.1 DUF4365 domain-containing protein [Myroides odoratimimus]MEC4009202.1 DUF4365 domain-containing protein [Myroides odoratimimus]
MKHDLYKINLPKDSRNIQLETISKNHFKSLFDTERFVIKEETIDNGIDFRLELKINNSVSGFGLNFQLKSTEKIAKNSDGSYSKSIKTSNIEYLLNNGQPGFYGFYIEQEKEIYYIELKEVINKLATDNLKWQEQSYHNIRFKNKLNINSINKIYNSSLADGISLRKTNALLAESLGQIKKNDVILTDFNNNVTAESEIISIIEDKGLILIDQCCWNEIINLHQKTTHQGERSAEYNLILGVAYYYEGEFFKSLYFLQEAYKKITLLDLSLKDYLLFVYYNLQRTLNIINQDEYEDVAKSFEENKSIHMHQQLEDIKLLKKEMYTSSNKKSKEFEEKIHDLIHNIKASDYIKTLAKIELLSYKSEQLIFGLFQLLAYNQIESVEKEFNEVSREYEKLCNYAQLNISNFTYHICNIQYCLFIIHFDCILRRMKNLRLSDEILPKVLNNINNTLLYFETIKHTENKLFTLTVLLEYYQNVEIEEKVQDVLNQLDTYKNSYSNHDFTKKINYTKEEGTFVSHLFKKKKEIDSNKNRIEALRKELMDLEQEEKKLDYQFDNSKLTIHLFPIGYFQFEFEKMNLLFDVLKIKDNILKNHLKELFKIIIPEINCFHDTIVEVGLLNGYHDYKGSQSFINVYNIRKQLFENQIYQVKIT